VNEISKTKTIYKVPFLILKCIVSMILPTVSLMSMQFKEEFLKEFINVSYILSLGFFGQS
jgi:hypothetical protein